MNRVEIFARTDWRDIVCKDVYYDPPTCNKLEERFETAIRDGFYTPYDRSIRSDSGQILARVEERQVESLEFWLPNIPKDLRASGLIKNPQGNSFTFQDVKVGAKNSLLLYENYFFAATCEGYQFSIIRPIREPFQRRFHLLYAKVFEPLPDRLTLTR